MAATSVRRDVDGCDARETQSCATLSVMRAEKRTDMIDRRPCRNCGEDESHHFGTRGPSAARLCMRLIGSYDPATTLWQRVKTWLRH